jgi:hypothetical protein
MRHGGDHAVSVFKVVCCRLVVSDFGSMARVDEVIFDLIKGKACQW